LFLFLRVGVVTQAIGRDGACKRRRLTTLISVGWLPPYRRPSRRLLRSRDEGRGLITRSKIAPIPGPRRRRGLEVGITGSARRPPSGARPSGGPRDEPRDGPGEGSHLAGDRHDDLVHVLTTGGQLPIPSAQAHLGFPADRLDLGGQLLQPQLQVSADLGRIPIRPRPFHQCAAGVAVARLRDAAR